MLYLGIQGYKTIPGAYRLLILLTGYKKSKAHVNGTKINSYFSSHKFHSWTGYKIIGLWLQIGYKIAKKFGGMFE